MIGGQMPSDQEQKLVDFMCRQQIRNIHTGHNANILTRMEYLGAACDQNPTLAPLTHETPVLEDSSHRRLTTGFASQLVIQEAR